MRLLRRFEPKVIAVIAFRIFAVLAATLLVGAVALGTLAPPDMSLADALVAAAPEALAHVRHVMTAGFGRAVWAYGLNPVLVRPIWLLPTSLGLLCVGAAATCFPPPSGHTKHRRS